MEIMNVDKKRKRFVPPIQKSLAIILASLVGSKITIELKNGSDVSGVLDECDPSINVTIVEADIVATNVFFLV